MQTDERAGWLEWVGRAIFISLLATAAGGVVAALLHRSMGGEAELGAVVGLAVLFGGLFHVGYAAFLPRSGAIRGVMFGSTMLLLTATTIEPSVGLGAATLLPYLAFGAVAGVVAQWLARHLPSGVSWWSGTGYAIVFGAWLLLFALFVVVGLDPASGGVVGKLAIASAFAFGVARHLTRAPALRLVALATLGLFCVLAAAPLVVG
ncbi:MAG: hypothetical protein ABI534_04510 [Chloroflexota bacterium]